MHEPWKTWIHDFEKELKKYHFVSEIVLGIVHDSFVRETEIVQNKEVEKTIKKLKINNFKTRNKKGKFSNKTLMFTGGFDKMSRSEAKSLVENNGGKVLGSISKKLDFLVVGDSKPTKRKIEQAKQLSK